MLTASNQVTTDSTRRSFALADHFTRDGGPVAFFEIVAPSPALADHFTRDGGPVAFFEIVAPSPAVVAGDCCNSHKKGRDPTCASSGVA